MSPSEAWTIKIVKWIYGKVSLKSVAFRYRLGVSVLWLVFRNAHQQSMHKVKDQVAAPRDNGTPHAPEQEAANAQGSHTANVRD